ncbi:MAG: hypothetical protein IE926_13520 [Micrococcales bacterium]|nr:hypothetical protein [Micrococcales bacterium]
MADIDDDVSAADDARTPPGEWGGPRPEAAEQPAAAETPVVEDEPASEPVEPAGEPVSRQADEAVSGDTPEQPASEDAPTEDAPTEGVPTEAAPTEDDAPTRDEAAEVVEDPGHGAFTEPEEPVADAEDPTPERDWSADEAEMLEENRERGDRLAEERAEMDREAADAGMEPVDPASAEPLPEEPETEDVADEQPGPEAAEDPQPEGVDEQPEPEAGDDQPAPAEASGSRRVSEFDEIRDGGFGMGSAAPLDDGAQPLDHPVQAYRDTMTYRVPEDPGYDSADPDVWFYDAAAAERSGFRRSEG